MKWFLALLLFCAAAEARHECNDFIDNDGDGLVDSADVGCDARGKKDESNCGDGICEGGETFNACPVDCVPEPAPEFVEYALEHQTVQGIPFPVRVRAVGYAVESPLSTVVIAHFNHARCADLTNTGEYECASGEWPLAEGMLYLAEALAEAGFSAYSLELNQLFWYFGAPWSQEDSLNYRAAMIDHHAGLVGADIAIGHSMGGQAVIRSTVPQTHVLMAPVVFPEDVADNDTLVVLAACDEDQGTHGFPGMDYVDRSVSDSVEVAQLLIPRSNHARFNSKASDPDWNICTVPLIENQRDIASEAIVNWLTGAQVQGRFSQFLPSDTPIELAFEGFAEVRSCMSDGETSGRPTCEDYDLVGPWPGINSHYYYLTQRLSLMLAFDGPATITPSVAGNWKLRVTYSIPYAPTDPTLQGQNILVPITDYPEPCLIVEQDPPPPYPTWSCSGWWQEVPRQMPHDMHFNGPIHLEGSGRIIVSDPRH